VRRRAPARRLMAGSVAILVFAAIAGIAIAPDLGGASTNNGAPPAALNRIAQKNDRAAVEAAARMREDSRREAERADALRSARERGRAEADAALARFDDNEAEPAAITR
jgi:hypothetical protein